MEENIKFLNKKEIARRFGITRQTLAKILKKHKEEIGEPIGYSFSPKQVNAMKSILGNFVTD
jgi:transposase-like protein